MTLRAFTMPKWGIEMQEGTLAEWLVREGDAFAKGQLIALVETDKITNEIEATEDGVLYKIVALEGETRNVGALLAVVGDAGQTADAIAAFAANFKAADASTAASQSSGQASATESTSVTNTITATSTNTIEIPNHIAISPKAKELALKLSLDVSQIQGSGTKGRITAQDVEQAALPAAGAVGSDHAINISVNTDELENCYASPLAKRLARTHSVDLTGVAGTGPRGRISKRDVLACIEENSTNQVSTDASPEILPMSSMRKTIARRLTTAKSTIPHFYLRSQIRLDALLEAKKFASAAAGIKLSVNDFLVKAVAASLLEHPNVNVHVHDDEIHRYTVANIAIAVATDKGLTTPVVRNAHVLTLAEISAASKQLVQRARSSRLTSEDLANGTFTVSNLGMFGIDQFDAIINPPQGAILAVGASRRIWAEQEDGNGSFETVIDLSLSCDHRAIDGALGAQFLTTLKEKIEDPISLF